MHIYTHIHTHLPARDGTQAKQPSHACRNTHTHTHTHKHTPAGQGWYTDQAIVTCMQKRRQELVEELVLGVGPLPSIRGSCDGMDDVGCTGEWSKRAATGLMLKRKMLAIGLAPGAFPSK